MRPYAPLRRIVSRRKWQTKYHDKHNFSVTLTLTCGHEKRYKASTAPERQARCDECAREPTSV